MKKVELIYVEVMNETEQFFIFETVFNKQHYAQTIVLNTALPITLQDMHLCKIILQLANMTRADATKSENASNVQV
ncbi:unnamed protein product [marine sediment metagenome]|uniref:Uncharacterized protein n=1 Tax=marine sediment metagenome TaxID=412755 RepID=X0ZUZ5_9ZZZZ